MIARSRQNIMESLGAGRPRQRLDPPVVEVGRAKDRPLWDRWYYLVALVGLLGTEWFLRRRFGYV